jgi:hypothetical protein
MNTIAKVSVAGALALGYVSANAAVVVPGSSGPSGTDVMLFAEVVSGTTVLGSYAGDTQVAVGSSLTGLSQSASTDTPLSQLLTLGQSSGNTIEWGVMGGKFTLLGTVHAGDTYLTTLTTAGSLALTTGGNLSNWSTGLDNTLTSVQNNAGTANSVFASTVALGGIWDGTLGSTATSNAANWYNTPGGSNVITGLTSATLYLVTSGESTATNSVVTDGTLTLSATGLTYSAGSPPPVPLPAAIWLLGGGLLGLFGIGRRKAATA